MRKYHEYYRSLDDESRESAFVEMMIELDIDPSTGNKYIYEDETPEGIINERI